MSRENKFQILILRSQRQSETVKKGEGKSHSEGVNNVIAFLVENLKEADVYRGWYETYPPYFCKREKWNKHDGHEYDIAVVRKTGDLERTYFIEVDGNSHDSKERKINDGVAEKFATEIKKAQIIRLSLTECLGDASDREIYLMRILWKFLK